MSAIRFSINTTEINLPGPLDFGSDYIDFSALRGRMRPPELWTRDEPGRGLEDVSIQASPARALPSVSGPLDFGSDYRDSSALMGRMRPPALLPSVSPYMRGLEILDEILPNTSLTAVDTFFWLADAVMSPERLSLDRAIQASSADMELQRDSAKCIDVTLHTYEETKSKDSCIICSDEFQSGDSVTTLLCNHTFHHKCIKEWGHYKPVCPLCKESIALIKENLGTNK